jgi:lysophospholipase L1-like esterase
MNRTRWFDIGAIAVAVAISVGLAGVSCSSGVAVPGPTASTVRDQRQGVAETPLALFIGDSYTAGGSTTEMSYGCRAAVQMGWLCALSAMGGTGYISGGVANRWVDPQFGKSLSLSERVPHLAAQYDPALVILDGGRNDVFAPPDAVYAAMLKTITEVRRSWPKAQIIFIRPRLLASPHGDLGFDDHFMARLESEPAARGVAFIDPINSFSDAGTSGLLASDGIHPNREGEQHMTTALLDSLVHVSHRLGWSL